VDSGLSGNFYEHLKHLPLLDDHFILQGRVPRVVVGFKKFKALVVEEIKDYYVADLEKEATKWYCWDTF